MIKKLLSGFLTLSISTLCTYGNAGDNAFEKRFPDANVGEISSFKDIKKYSKQPPIESPYIGLSLPQKKEDGSFTHEEVDQFQEALAHSQNQEGHDSKMESAEANIGNELLVKALHAKFMCETLKSTQGREALDGFIETNKLEGSDKKLVLALGEINEDTVISALDAEKIPFRRGQAFQNLIFGAGLIGQGPNQLLYPHFVNLIDKLAEKDTDNIYLKELQELRKAELESNLTPSGAAFNGVFPTDAEGIVALSFQTITPLVHNKLKRDGQVTLAEISKDLSGPAGSSDDVAHNYNDSNKLALNQEGRHMMYKAVHLLTHATFCALRAALNLEAEGVLTNS